MKFKLTSILFLLNILISFSQNICSDNFDLKKFNNQEINKNNALGILDLGLYYNNKNYNESLSNIENVLIFSEKNNFIEGIARAFVAYSSYYYTKGDFSASMNYCLKAIKLLDITKDTEALIEVKNNIAKIERENDNFEKGIEICLNLISELEKEPNSIQLARIHLNAANIYMNIKGNKFNNALIHLNKANTIFKKKDCESGIAMTQIKYSRFYKILYLREKKIENLKVSRTYADKANNTFKNKKQINNIAYANYTLGTLYSIEGNHKASIPFYTKGLVKFKEIENLSYQMRINQHLFVAYSILNQQGNALKSNKKFISIKDSIFNIEKRKFLADSQTKFETEKIKNQKEIAELESKKNRNLFIGSIVIACLLLIASLFYFGRLKAKKKTELIALELKEIQKRLALEKQYKDSELKALKAQMNPHFIFNALNSIQDYIVLNQKNLASDYLGKFADLIRNYLHFSDLGFISIPDEIHNLNLYLELEKLRFEEQLQYSFKIDDNANSETIKIPTMLIQPYVENALKHGLLHIKEERKLSISISKESNKIIECIIEDNGVGREKSKELNAKKELHHKSFASNATSQRLDLLNFGKEKKIGVEIIDLKDDSKALGTKVILKIPVIK
ncbi:histidine kinase [Lutibacter sp. Hel_I_33_5]|uniref:sensor histidine kinase n=1 Tax=Lutibacter sp. Hel_I_33_5 TaxID=1566289 RepID=UPI0011A8B3F6|nr:histidine kinase [Lutibacter sp. Hel_I_33_5]TVZ56905.1 histidine kinase [Lutibacter sp. Hel_I_33_5]